MGAIDSGEGSQLTPADEQLLGPNIPTGIKNDDQVI